MEVEVDTPKLLLNQFKKSILFAIVAHRPQDVFASLSNSFRHPVCVACMKISIVRNMTDNQGYEHKCV